MRRVLIILLTIGVLFTSGCTNSNEISNSTTPGIDTNNLQPTTQVEPTSSQTDTNNSNVKIVDNEKLCNEDEEVIFSFKAEHSDKILSVCMSKNQEYIVYRFGTKEKVEIEFPEDKTDSWSKFIYSYYLRGGENEGMDMNYLMFENGGFEYEIYQEYTTMDESTIVGVRIKDKSTNKETNIKGLPESIIGSLTGLRDNDKIKIEN